MSNASHPLNRATIHPHEKGETMDGLISIIIPVYNRASTLERCLDSIFTQTAPLQVIAIDDGSQDNSLALLKEYAQREPRLEVLTQANSGPSAARNLGIERARGEFTTFVDSDDWLEPDILAQSLAAARQHAPLDLIIWAYRREFPNASLLRQVLGPEPVLYAGPAVRHFMRRFCGPLGRELDKPQWIDSLVSVWGKLYRTSIIKEHNLHFADFRQIYSEDTLFNFSYTYYARQALYLPQGGYHWRHQGSSLSSSFIPNLFQRWYNLHQLMERFIETHSLDNSFREALSNRRALCLIGLGLNIMASPQNILQRYRELQRFLYHPLYKRALRHLDLSPMPLHWRFFYACARRGFTPGVYALLAIMNWLRAHYRTA